MFTIKLVTAFKSRLVEAESFTVLYGSSVGSEECIKNWAEVTAHFKDGGQRFDIGESPHQPGGGLWDQAYIMNSAGKTVENINYGIR